VAPAVEHERAAENPRIGPEAALPESLGKNHDIVVARLLFARREDTAEDRPDRQNRKEVARHGRRRERLGLLPAGPGQGAATVGRQRREGVALGVSIFLLAIYQIIMS
jgi:hypothetical protein